jgi:hypothetical protein
MMKNNVCVPHITAYKTFPQKKTTEKGTMNTRVSHHNRWKQRKPKHDGKRVSRYLLTAFFTQEGLAKSSFTRSELSQYTFCIGKYS